MRFMKWKWVLRIGLLLMVVTLSLPFIVRLIVMQQGRALRDPIIAKLDAADPNWKLEELEKELNARLPPDDQNPFVTAKAAYDAMPKDWSKQLDQNAELGNIPSNAKYAKEDRDMINAALKDADAGKASAMKLATMPANGGRKLAFPENPINELLTSIQDMRRVAYFLKLLAETAAEDGKLDEAIQATQACLALTRAIGDEPMLIGQLVRIAIGAVAAKVAERVINLSQPDAGLTELQAAFAQAAEYPTLSVGLRGERAFSNRLMELIEKGQFNPDGMNSTLAPLQAWVMRTVLYHSWATMLDAMSRALAATKLPIEQQIAVLKQVENSINGRDLRNIFTRLLMPAVSKVSEASLRNWGQLHAAAVSIACERFRRINGRWPNTLEEIPKAILAKIPVDPFTGKPLVYKRLPDGIVVYTVGPDGIDNGGDITGTTGANGTRPTDFGIRLYDVSKRGIPAPPKPQEDPIVPDPEDP